MTAHPTAEWIAQQFIEAFAWRDAPRYVVRDRDCVFDGEFIQRVRAMGIRDRPTSPRSPWQMDMRKGSPAFEGVERSIPPRTGRTAIRPQTWTVRACGASLLRDR